MTIFKVETIISEICIEIQKQYGRGLLESVYEEILCYELAKRNMSFLRQQPIDVIHDEVLMNVSLRADIIVENSILVELKSVSELQEGDMKRVVTCLKLAKLRLGLLINFNESLVKGGIIRVVNEL